LKEKNDHGEDEFHHLLQLLPVATRNPTNGPEHGSANFDHEYEDDHGEDHHGEDHHGDDHHGEDELLELLPMATRNPMNDPEHESATKMVSIFLSFPTLLHFHLHFHLLLERRFHVLSAAADLHSIRRNFLLATDDFQ
jgi:hypothetical protein